MSEVLRDEIKDDGYNDPDEGDSHNEQDSHESLPFKMAEE